MMTRSNFDRELEELHNHMIQMASLVEEAIEGTINALLKHDMVLAKLVHEGDDQIDNLEKVIEKQCLNLIAKQQPIAKDLRTIGAALKIITDLERIGDHCSDIAKITMGLADEKFIKPLVDIPKMAMCVKLMVKQSIDAYVRQDVELGRTIYFSDDEVDGLFEKVIFDVMVIMKNNPTAVEQGIKLILIAKYLERMADHATNIGEWVVYNVTGEHDVYTSQQQLPQQ